MEMQYTWTVKHQMLMDCSGANGVVSLAVDKQTGEQVAIKLVPRGRGSQAELCSRCWALHDWLRRLEPMRCKYPVERADWPLQSPAPAATCS